MYMGNFLCKNKLHEKIIKDTTKGEPLNLETYKTVLKHLKNKNENMFLHITKAGQYFQDAMFIYMADFMENELVTDTYDYTKLFGLQKGNKLDPNMTRYIHGKELDAKFLEALVSERMKPLITKNCPKMQIGGMKGNSSSANLIVVKTWMKTNEVGETVCIFKAFDMEKFFDKEGLIDTFHTI